MNQAEFTLDNFNPDNMTETEIMEWINFIGNGTINRQSAKQLFPDDNKKKYIILQYMRNYLWNKLTAINLRLKGNIGMAMYYEEICDKIYDDLSVSVRW